MEATCSMISEDPCPFYLLLCHLPHVGSISYSEMAIPTPTIMFIFQKIGNKDGEGKVCSFSLKCITLWNQHDSTVGLTLK